MSRTEDMLAVRQQRQRIMTTALREWDPDADLSWDADSGRLSIHTTLSAERVSTILSALGEQVTRCGDEPYVADNESCCGCCGH